MSGIENPWSTHAEVHDDRVARRERFAPTDDWSQQAGCFAREGTK